MGKVSVECPRCGKSEKVEWDDKKPWILKNPKESSCYPLLRQKGHNEWTEDWTDGLGIRCKCGKVYFVYDSNQEQAPTQTDIVLRPGFSIAFFCESCGKAFIDPEVRCPTCHQQYT